MTDDIDKVLSRAPIRPKSEEPRAPYGIIIVMGFGLAGWLILIDWLWGRLWH
jgi:hypothetical protein